QAQPAQAHPPPPKPPPPFDSAKALKNSPVAWSTPLRSITLDFNGATERTSGWIVDARLPIVFSVQPANEAATSPKLVVPPTAGPCGAAGMAPPTAERVHTGR